MLFFFILSTYLFAQSPSKGVQVIKPSLAKPLSTLNLSNDVHELLSVVAGNKPVKGKASFTARACDKDKLAWIKMAFTRSPRMVQYVYGKDCDVDGKFNADLGIPFGVNLKVRNLGQYQSANMKVLMQIKPVVGEIEFHFDCMHGVLKSPKETVEFKAWYKIRIDPLSGGEESKSGEITILKVNGKAVNLKQQIKS